MTDKFLPLAEDFLRYVNASRSPFHAVATSIARLKGAGFKELNERRPFDIERGGRYYFTRNQSSLVAFTVGGKWKKGGGFSVVGAHTDSPNFKLKPVSNISKSGYLQVGVQCYGGGLWHTWFDRDLTVAGRVIVSSESDSTTAATTTTTGDGDSSYTYESRLVSIDRPILRIPTLAIHLDRGVNENLKINKENHLVPVLATAIKNQLETTINSPEESKDNDKDAGSKNAHHPVLVQLLADTLNVVPSHIHSFELSVCDASDAVIGGIHREFIFSPRLDNLMSCFCALEALTSTSTDTSIAPDESVRMIVLFDHEEVGSQSAYGAMSPLVEDAFTRISQSLDNSTTPSDLRLSKNKSFVISADMAHAVHPNYSEKHESGHRPEMHKGPVIKVNANQRYATTAETSMVLEILAKEHNIPLQKFVVRNDSPCGSTIGPILSSRLGVRTVDIGNPQLSMHSVREMCGVDDTTHCTNLLKVFFEHFTSVDQRIKID